MEVGVPGDCSRSLGKVGFALNRFVCKDAGDDFLKIASEDRRGSSLWLEVQVLVMDELAENEVGCNTIRSERDICPDSSKVGDIGTVFTLDLAEERAGISFCLVVQFNRCHVGSGLVFPASKELECGVEEVGLGRRDSVVVMADVEQMVALLHDIQQVLPISELEQCDLSLGVLIQLLSEAEESFDGSVGREDVGADDSFIVA